MKRFFAWFMRSEVFAVLGLVGIVLGAASAGNKDRLGDAASGLAIAIGGAAALVGAALLHRNK